MYDKLKNCMNLNYKQYNKYIIIKYDDDDNNDNDDDACDYR